MGVDKYTPELIARNQHAFSDQREDELRAWSRDLTRWNQELSRQDPARHREGAVVLEDAELKRGAAMERLRELHRQSRSDEDAWREMRDGIDLAYQQAKEAFARAKEWFGS